MYSYPGELPMTGPIPSSPGSGQQNVPPKASPRRNNTLVLVPPGFKRRVELPFPDRCLPVCVRCKKNYKTRELCRSRDGHTDLPWSTTYICVTLDPSCLDEDGRLIDGPFKSKSLKERSYCAQGSLAPTTPICAPCKEKNYTRNYCREKQNHRQLPWSTVYVELSAENPGGHECRNDFQRNGFENPSIVHQQADADTVSNGLDSPGSTRKVKEETDDRDPKRRKLVARTSSPKAVGEALDGGENDSIFPVAESMTFVLKLSSEGCVMHWVDVDKSVKTRSPRLTKVGEGRQDPTPPIGELPPPHPNYGYCNPAPYPPYQPPTFDAHYQYPQHSQWYPHESNMPPQPYEHPAQQDYYPPISNYDQEQYDHFHPPPPTPSYQHPQNDWHSQQPWHAYHTQPGPESYPSPTTDDSGQAQYGHGEYSYYQEEMPPPELPPMNLHN